MILSNVEMQRAMDEGRLVIDPRPSPELPDLVGESDAQCPYQTSSVDLTLANEISFFRPGLPIQIDLSLGSFPKLFGPNSESRTITAEQPFSLIPNRLVLARTRERISLPLSTDPDIPSLAARVEGKSSYARCGLLVHCTAPTIHAGFEGTITLEIINLGSLPIMLSPGIAICQLIVEEVRGIPFRNDSRFQGQVRAGGATLA